MNEKMKEFGQKVETVVSILGSYIENNIKDREKFDRQLKGLFETGEQVLKNTIKTAMSSEFVKASMGLSEESPSEQKDADLETDVVDKKAKKLLLKVQKLSHYKGELPKYESSLAAGFDVRAQIDKELTLKPGDRELIPTGLCIEIPEGFEIQARPRSGLAIKKGIGLVNSPGTIDADYRGEIKIIIINHSSENVVIEPQQRIAQLVLAPVFQAEFQEVDQLSETDRGAGGFGSTGN